MFERILVPLMVGFALAFLWFAPMFAARAATSICLASYYGAGEPLNTHTASGERFNPRAMTCVHRTYSFGTRLRVTRVKTGQAVVCRVNDRGPARATGRCIDLAYGAAVHLGMIHKGVAKVRIEVAG